MLAGAGLNSVETKRTPEVHQPVGDLVEVASPLLPGNLCQVQTWLSYLIVRTCHWAAKLWLALAFLLRGRDDAGPKYHFHRSP